MTEVMTEEHYVKKLLAHIAAITTERDALRGALRNHAIHLRIGDWPYTQAYKCDECTNYWTLSEPEIHKPGCLVTPNGGMSHEPRTS